MNAEEIREATVQIQTVALAKGLHRPNVQFTVEPNKSFWVYVGWSDPADDNYKPGRCKIMHGETAEECIETTNAWLDSLPTVEEQNMRNFMNLMSKAVEFGRDKGFDAEFINPLEMAMKSLSRNALKAGVHLGPEPIAA
jgi:hypothetical protein